MEEANNVLKKPVMQEVNKLGDSFFFQVAKWAFPNLLDNRDKESEEAMKFELWTYQPLQGNMAFLNIFTSSHRAMHFPASSVQMQKNIMALLVKTLSVSALRLSLRTTTASDTS